jgi:CRP-like cAMP-binding protein
MVLSGKIKFMNSKRVETTVTRGNYFGHEEILSGISIINIKALDDSQLIYIPAKIFAETLSDYFTDKLQKI